MGLRFPTRLGYGGGVVLCIVMELGEYPELWPIVIKVGRGPNPNIGVIVV